MRLSEGLRVKPQIICLPDEDHTGMLNSRCEKITEYTTGSAQGSPLLQRRGGFWGRKITLISQLAEPQDKSSDITWGKTIQKLIKKIKKAWFSTKNQAYFKFYYGPARKYRVQLTIRCKSWTFTTRAVYFKQRPCQGRRSFHSYKDKERSATDLHLRHMISCRNTATVQTPPLGARISQWSGFLNTGKEEGMAGISAQPHSTDQVSKMVQIQSQELSCGTMVYKRSTSFRYPWLRGFQPHAAGSVHHSQTCYFPVSWWRLQNITELFNKGWRVAPTQRIKTAKATRDSEVGAFTQFRHMEASPRGVLTTPDLLDNLGRKQGQAPWVSTGVILPRNSNQKNPCVAQPERKKCQTRAPHSISILPTRREQGNYFVSKLRIFKVS